MALANALTGPQDWSGERRASFAVGPQPRPFVMGLPRVESLTASAVRTKLLEELNAALNEARLDAEDNGDLVPSEEQIAMTLWLAESYALQNAGTWNVARVSPPRVAATFTRDGRVELVFQHAARIGRDAFFIGKNHRIEWVTVVPQGR